MTSTVVGIDASEKAVSHASEEPGRGCRAYLVFGYSAPPSYVQASKLGVKSVWLAETNRALCCRKMHVSRRDYRQTTLALSYAGF